jgi:hypothetical protein
MGASDQITWVNRPLKGRTGVTVFLAALFPVLAGLVYLESRNAAVTALALAFVGVAISPAILPTRYVVDPGGVLVSHFGRTRHRPWTAFRRLIVDSDVIVLSPFAKPSFLDSFRGQYLRFNRDQESLREEVLRFVLGRLPRRHECQGSAAPNETESEEG